MKHLVLAFALALTLMPRCVAADLTVPTLPLGSAAPDFRLPGVDGRTYTLQDFAQSKLLAVVFTCNHCPTAQYYEERLKSLVREYAPRGVGFVAIMPNDPKSVRLDELGWTDLSDTFDEMKLRAKHKAFNFAYLFDGETEEASRKYGPVATPHIFIFDAERKLRYQGRIDDSEREQFVRTQDARDVLNTLLEGKEPKVTKTKVVGCSIKWAGKADAVKTYLDKLAAEPVSVKAISADELRALRQNGSGKFRLVNFWATWCAPCIAEFPELVTINRMYRHRDFELMTISVNRPDEEKDVVAFLKKQQASNANYIFGSPDRDPLINAFDPDWPGTVPLTVLLSPEGQVLYRELGSIDALSVKRVIVEKMNARKPW